MSELSPEAAKKLKNGYSTGSCAAAASHAALAQLLFQQELHQVNIELPDGETINIPIKGVFVNNGQATAEVIKDAGDDPDVTHGISILATVELLDEALVRIEGGQGVGRVTKPGLAVKVGEAAINPVPQAMIRGAVQKLLPPGKGVKVVISVPQGEEIARRTMNPRLGIEGGISILGTSGIVRPMSEEAFLASLRPQLDQAIALGYRELLFTPGKMGERQAKAMGIAADCIIQTSNYIGAMIQQALQQDVKAILLMGHIGKMIKVAAGIFNTHSHIADARRETLAAHAAMLGASPETVREIMQLNNMEASVALIKAHRLERAYYSIAASATQRVNDFIAVNSDRDDIKVGTMLYALNGEILGYDEAGLQLWQKMSGRDDRPNQAIKQEVAAKQGQSSLQAADPKERFPEQHTIKVVGTGPGDPAYISPLALEAIRSAEVLIGARRLLDRFAEFGQEQIAVDRDLASVLVHIEAKRRDHRVVVLVSGDTGIFSLADYLVKHMDHEVFTFIPGISSLQVMFARLKRPWQEAQILSMHGRSHEGLAGLIKSAPLTALFTGVPWTPPVIAQYLLAQGLPDLQVALGKDLSYPEEKLVYCSLQALSSDTDDYINTVMVIFNA
ncbi:MAG TPA: cobalt-precorrin-5B (C(1))-methyltransferase CbiD [Syntrophomonas sp.]|nr:cobalt-precorrin-5B (C(1))-methyltransferase CbiD [Syntrophomonas sp.]